MNYAISQSPNLFSNIVVHLVSVQTNLNLLKVLAELFYDKNS